MKRLPVSTVLFAFASVALSPSAFAGANTDARILLHLTNVTTKSTCTRPEARPACTDIVTHGSLNQSYFGYLLVGGADATAGISGVQFGISYGSGRLDGIGLDIWSWTTCGTLGSPSWTPDSNTGTIITWDAANACQRYEPGGPGTGVVAAAGYFYLTAYGSAVISVIPRPTDGIAAVGDCSQVTDIVEGGEVHHVPTHLGSLGFGTEMGYNAWCPPPVPSQSSTWSGIKAQTGEK